ncbi:hypothetical protein [Zavarzinia compransoris]|uniref:Uncharacterized protein n=1 Tax=Zavarzinia compransoris TaxID=1264899 RepID=A0A317EAI7_9PROT|nr:hypothetical protein [Zavarzinia compransoris]PWR23691.1 hypothetical protein DKG75_03745 [Zavarzinia compransoris]TDP47911.1 hypothetical protein DES42_102207 [Zavarzinia compransoris]
MNMKAFITMSDPWDLATSYQFNIDCMIDSYICDKPHGAWRCLLTPDVGIGYGAKLSYRFKAGGRHHGVFLKRNSLTPAGFSSIDLDNEDQVHFIGAICLYDEL